MKLVVSNEISRVIEIVSRMIINSRRGRYGTYAKQEKKEVPDQVTSFHFTGNGE
jgi:hypothetical protein